MWSSALCAAMAAWTLGNGAGAGIAMAPAGVVYESEGRVSEVWVGIPIPGQAFVPQRGLSERVEVPIKSKCFDKKYASNGRPADGKWVAGFGVYQECITQKKGDN